MAFKFNAILKFNGDGVKRQVNKASRSFKGMTNSVKKASASIGKMGQGLKGLTLAGAPLTAGIALATKEFADFEKQMSIVKSLTGDITKKEFASMTAEAKRLGASTSFSAKEAASGFEFLALAGFNVEDQIGSLESVLNLAAAGSMELGLASDIVTDSMGSLSPALDKNASKVENLNSLVDKMAFIQSKTNTNVTQLGEAIKFGGGAMAAAKVPLDSILVAMGGLANAGLKGSIGGTALTNAFTKMAKPTTKAKALFEKLNIKLRDAQGNFLPMPKLMANITKGMDSVQGGAEKMAVAQELFGLRGQRAIFALMSEGTKSLQKLEDGIKNATGAAAAQAKTRLDNLAGSFTIMKSAISGVLIETGGLVAGFLTKPIRKAADMLSGISVGFQLVTGQIDKTSKGGQAFFKQFGEKRGKAILAFIDGFVEGFKEVGNFVTEVGGKIAAFFGQFIDNSEGSEQSMGKLVAKIIAIGAIAAPILAAIGAAFFVLGPIIAGVSGFVGLVSSAFGFLASAAGLVGAAIGFILSPVGLLVVALGAIAFGVFKMIGGLQGLKEAAVTFGAGFMQAFMPVIDMLAEELMPIWNMVKGSFEELFGSMGQRTDKASNDLTGFGQTVGKVMAFIALAITPVIKLIGFLVSGIAQLVTGAISLGSKFGKYLGFGSGEDRPGANAKSASISPAARDKAAFESAKIQKESVEQKALVQPASAEQTGKAVANVINTTNTSSGGSGGTSTTKVVLELRGDAGKLLNKKVTEDRINNSFEQGKDVKNKHQKRSNGLALAN